MNCQRTTLRPDPSTTYIYHLRGHPWVHCGLISSESEQGLPPGNGGVRSPWAWQRRPRIIVAMTPVPFPDPPPNHKRPGYRHSEAPSIDPPQLPVRPSHSVDKSPTGIGSAKLWNLLPRQTLDKSVGFPKMPRENGHHF